MKTTQRLFIYAFVPAACTIFGCDAAEEQPMLATEQADVTASIQTLRRSSPDVGVVGTLLAAQGDTTEMRYAPGELAYSVLADAVDSASRLAAPLHVYELAPAVQQDPVGRALVLGISNPELVASDATSSAMLRSSDRPELTLRLHSKTGFETFLDESRFQRIPGSGRDRGNAFYIAKATQHIQANVRAKGQTHYVYRVRRTRNGVQGPNTEPVISLGQVTVVLNDSVDNVPVIGPGSKLAVFMDSDGVVTGHQDSMRNWKTIPIATLQTADLVPPADAQKEVESILLSDGLDLDSFTLKRKELGYMRWLPEHDQKLLAPYYCFVYEPKAGVVAKRRVEWVPAVQEPEMRGRILGDAEKSVETDEERRVE